MAGWLMGLGALALLAREAFFAILRSPMPWRELLYQIHFVGVKSQSVVLITGAFTGMVLSAQTYFQFHKVKMDTATLAVTGVSMCSELGPVLAALMVAGRVGAAIAAELGSMRVTEQIDALYAMATDPIHYLVVPRVNASILMLPILTLIGDAVGIIGGWLVSVGLFGANSYLYMERTFQFLEVNDITSGLVKSAFFGLILSVTGCAKGFYTSGGAEGVGRSTTSAVVTASLYILLSDFFLTKILF